MLVYTQSSFSYTVEFKEKHHCQCGIHSIIVYLLFTLDNKQQLVCITYCSIVSTYKITLVKRQKRIIVKKNKKKH